MAWTLTADFESGTLGQPAIGADACSYAGSTTVFNNTRAKTGSRSVRATISQGSDGWGEWHGEFTVSAGVPQGGEIWYRIYFYYPTGWDWSTFTGGSMWTKIMRIPFSATSSKVSILARNGGGIWIGNELTSNDQNSGVAFGYDAWVCIELYMYVHSNASQGIIRAWKNGILIHQRFDQTLPSSGATTSTGIMLFNQWNNGAPQTQSCWTDAAKITDIQPANQDAAGNYMIGPTDWGGGPQPPAAPTNLRLV